MKVRSLAARLSRHGRIVAEDSEFVKKYRVHPTHWLITTQVDDGGGSILSGATALRTGTVNAGGEKISVGCLIRLEMNEAAGAFRLTVRTAVPHVSTALAEAIQKLL